MEGDFYSSLSNLCMIRGFSIPKTRQMGFPYNMAITMQNLQQELKASGAEAQDIRLVQDGDEVFFARQERFDTGMTLYYIPVEPLFFMLHDKVRKQASKLLLSVFAYLYQVAHIPYHRHEGNYLFYTYDMLNDWKMQDDEDYLEFRKSYDRMEFVGDAIELKIRHPENLKQFEKRLYWFRANDRFDEKCLKLAKQAFGLFRQYPNTRIYHKCGEVLCGDDEHDAGTQIALDSYVSFYGSACGELSDLLIETVNADLQ